jgi:hypothetical protein
VFTNWKLTLIVEIYQNWIRKNQDLEGEDNKEKY